MLGVANPSDLGEVLMGLVAKPGEGGGELKNPIQVVESDAGRVSRDRQ